MEPLKEMTWDDLADDYKAATGRTARAQPMDVIWEWAEKQPNIYVISDEGYLLKKGEPHE